MKKLLGDIDFSKVDPTSYNLFEYTRLTIADQNTTEEIKKSEFFDQTVANTRNTLGNSSKTIYYPKETGIYKWIKILEKQAKDLGVIFKTG